MQDMNNGSMYYNATHTARVYQAFNGIDVHYYVEKYEEGTGRYSNWKTVKKTQSKAYALDIADTI